MDSPSDFGTAMCEVCARPMPAGTRPVRVGACEFPFHVHDECFPAMGPLADEVTLMCASAAREEQPDGLLWLGSWEPLATDAEAVEANAVENRP